VAGASEPRKELVAIARRLGEGKVLVTMATEELPMATIVELLGVALSKPRPPEWHPR